MTILVGHLHYDMKVPDKLYAETGLSLVTAIGMGRVIGDAACWDVHAVPVRMISIRLSKFSFGCSFVWFYKDAACTY